MMEWQPDREYERCVTLKTIRQDDLNPESGWGPEVGAELLVCKVADVAEPYAHEFPVKVIGYERNGIRFFAESKPGKYITLYLAGDTFRRKR